MDLFTTVFIIALGFSLILKFGLLRRHVNHVKQHRGQVPAEYGDKISLQEHQKAADYTTSKAAVNFVQMPIEAAILLFWTLGGGLSSLDHFWRGFDLSAISTVIAVILSLMLVSAVLDLPFGLYRTFVMEERFGFNKMTLRLLISDTIKNTFISLAIVVPLIAIFLWLMDLAGPYWWAYGWMVWMSFILLMIWAYPNFIAPLFNQFKELDDKELRQSIENLIQRCGFEANDIFVMDGSKRSGHGNAYFTGFGKSKRVVFYDTLIESLSIAQVEAVLAHELGHFKRKHINKQMAVMAVSALASLAVLGFLMQQAWFYAGLGVDQASSYMALILFMMIYPLFTILLGPLQSILSRKHEYEADAYAAEQANAEDLISALVTMYKDNAATLTPDPLYSAFYDSHPPAPLRIAHLRGLKHD